MGFSADLDLATGAEVDSNININGSSLTVSNDALFQADNDFNVNGVAQNSNTRSNNKSSSAAIGGYASTGSGVGITASASKGKGYANSDSVTYANSNINVGNTTTFDIGNDVNIKGGVINTDKIQGAIGGDMTIESLQDTYTYDSDQKNAGFTLDVALEGAGSSLSVNGGKTNLNADYQAVGAQSGIFANEADLVTEGKGNFIGGVFTTSADAQANGKSNIAFKQGVTSQDINNTTSYDGDAFSAGVSIGNITNKPQASMNGLGYGTDSDSDSSITKGGVSGFNDPEGILTTENREVLGGKLKSVFDAQKVNEELGAQVEITQALDNSRKELKKELYADVTKKREQATDIRRGNNGRETSESLRLETEAANLNEKVRWIDAGLGALWGIGDTGLFTGMFATTQADRVKMSATAPKEMWYQTCSASTGGQCESRQIWSLNDLTQDELNLIKKADNTLTLSNPGIFNDKEASLANAAKQNTNDTNKVGALVVMNQPTGKYDGWWILSSLTSELMYAGYDKFNDTLGGKLPLTNSEKLNQDIYLEALEKGLQIDTSNHSRGGLTGSVALKDLNNNQGVTQVPIRQSRFYGTATNVQDYADQLAKNGYTYVGIDKDGNEIVYQSGAYSAVHKADFVGRPPIILGGNPATGGECWACYSHSSYYAEIPAEYLTNNQGQYINNAGKVVSETQKVENPLYVDFVDKWGTPKDNINPSIPVLVKPKNPQLEGVYNEDAFYFYFSRFLPKFIRL